MAWRLCHSHLGISNLTASSRKGHGPLAPSLNSLWFCKSWYTQYVICKSKHNKVLKNISFVKQKIICLQIRWFPPGILFVDMNISRQIQGGHNLKEIQELIIQRHKLRYYDCKSHNLKVFARFEISETSKKMVLNTFIAETLNFETFLGELFTI